ncbi:hypothetical protein [Aquabacter spiritensis]|uniref:hypothetical protein n=1 Tax=Aquabacter spiritensis TaxID=933073 RepID=UPI00140435A2|nr:hypothetical protein [Aquabacter spiritensis]
MSRLIFPERAATSEKASPMRPSRIWARPLCRQVPVDGGTKSSTVGATDTIFQVS